MPPAPPPSARDWTLLVLAAAAGDAVQPVQLQKALFLLGENLPGIRESAAPFYAFRPYDYGPFCADVYDDVAALAAGGLVMVERSANTTYHTYRATPAGLECATSLRASMDPRRVAYLDQLTAWVRGQSFNSLLRAVYSAYPKMAVNSVFRS